MESIQRQSTAKNHTHNQRQGNVCQPVGHICDDTRERISPWERYVTYDHLQSRLSVDIVVGCLLHKDAEHFEHRREKAKIVLMQIYLQSKVLAQRYQEV